MRRLADADTLAIDTEFVRERTYYAKLCVLQIATDDLIAAVDCLADIRLDKLFAALARSNVSWVMHSARQDLEVLVPQTGSLPARLIDTQIAAAMLGLPLQVGLQGLLSEILDVSIGKEHTRIDWSRRPLAPEAIAYALDDVRYLLSAWRELHLRLESAGRSEWFTQDCARQLELPLLPSAESIFERTKGTGGLSGRQRDAALALVRWREERAMQRDKPRRWILADDQLVRIAASVPDSPEALQRVDDLPKSLVSRSGKAILAAIRNPERAPPVRDMKIPDKKRLRSLQDQVKSLAARLNVPPELLATRRDLARVAAGQTPELFVSGWRGEVLRDLLQDFSQDPAS